MSGRNRLAVLAALLLALAGCGAADDAGRAGSPGQEGGSVTAQANAENNAADVGFALLMAEHHRQTIEMTKYMEGKDSVGEEIESLAIKIQSVHEPETAQLEGMLRAWGQLEGSAGSQRSHAPGGADMAGMVGARQMDELAAAEGEEAGRLFLELMIAHHEATIEVAKDELANGSNAEAMALARTIVETQEQELTRMQAMLERHRQG